MNNNNHTTEHLDADDIRAEIEDQLMDRCLEEVLGGVSPQLAERKAQPVALAPGSTEETETDIPAPRRTRWSAMFVAIGLLLCAGIALQSGVFLPNAESPDELVTMSEAPTEEEETLPAAYYQRDDVGYHSENHPFAQIDDVSSFQTQAVREQLVREQQKNTQLQVELEQLPGKNSSASPGALSELTATNGKLTNEVESLRGRRESKNDNLYRFGAPATPSNVDGLAIPAPAQGVPQLNKLSYQSRLHRESSGLGRDSNIAKKPISVTATAPATEASLGLERKKFRWEEESRARDFGTDGLEGVGPGNRGDNYAPIIENEFQAVADAPLSTFSIDVDTASYSNVRRMLTQNNMLPPPDAVRIEEMLNYFNYDYKAPVGDDPFSVTVDATDCPWRPEHKLVRIALKGKEIPLEEKPASNLVFLLDVSGSMNQPNKIELLKSCLKMMVDYLGENDSMAIVTYASGTRVVLPSTSGDQKAVIMNALDNLRAGGSTNGAAGIQLAYEQATKSFIPGGINRVILATDGDFNVGITSDGDLHRMIEEKAKSNVFLTTLGFGFGNLQDNKIELLADKGNGNYAYIDTLREGRKVLIDEMGSTLHTIAKDVKIQIEFNPVEVAGYRLIGYENRILAARDFNDDTKDAGEIGAGHTVTALYELIPAGEQPTEKEVDDLEFQKPLKPSKAAKNGDMMVVKLRYKQPTADKSQLLKMNVANKTKPLVEMSRDFQFASAVASFGMILRGSKFVGHANYDTVLEIAESSLGDNPESYREEFVGLVKLAKELDQRH